MFHISPLSLRHFQLLDTLRGVALINQRNWDDGYPNWTCHAKTFVPGRLHLHDFHLQHLDSSGIKLRKPFGKLKQRCNMIHIKNFFRNPRQSNFLAYQQLCQKNICRVPPLRTSWWWPHRNDSQNSPLIHEVCKYYWPSLCHYHDQSFIVFAWKYLGAWNTKWSVITTF